MISTSSSESSLEAFEPRQSLWKLVEEFAPDSEQREIKEVLGQDIIDETNDLHREVQMLLEIWQDYKEDNDKKFEDKIVNTKLSRLPEPPQVRENLKKEIQLFVKALKQRSIENGNSDDVLQLSEREEGIVKYALKGTDLSSMSAPTRPLTARSSESGRLTPYRSTSSSDSGSRSSSSLGDVMESFYNQINLQDFDNLATKLRNILLEEKESLIDDVAFLQSCLFEESQFSSQSQVIQEPSLQEMKELGIKLEKEMSKKSQHNPATSLRNSCHSSPTRRPARPRNLCRSTSSPTVGSRISPISMCEKSDVNASPSSQSEQESLSPSPPTSAPCRRPGSAARFRKLVLSSRNSET